MSGVLTRERTQRETRRQEGHVKIRSTLPQAKLLEPVDAGKRKESFSFRIFRGSVALLPA